MAAKKAAPFSAEAIGFLAQLSRNNNRDWFNENKPRYEELVLDSALRFIESMQDPLHDIAPHFTAVPKRVGGSLMRIYRDTRFSKDKTPYKTNVGIQFRHEQARDVHSPGYYVHIDPEQVFIGVGMWRPESESLAQIRRRIADKTNEWRKASRDRSFRRHFELGGETLSRPPRGFDKDHPMIDDLKRKDFIAVKNLDLEDVTSPGFQRKIATAFRAATPFMQFLCKAVGVRY